MLVYAVMAIVGSWVYPLLTVYLPHHDYGDEPLTQTRTLRGRIIPAIFLELTYHLEHHLYPQVPSHHLPELARRLDPYFAARRRTAGGGAVTAAKDEAPDRVLRAAVQALATARLRGHDRTQHRGDRRVRARRHLLLLRRPGRRARGHVGAHQPASARRATAQSLRGRDERGDARRAASRAVSTRTPTRGTSRRSRS